MKISLAPAFQTGIVLGSFTAAMVQKKPWRPEWLRE
jgi:hypothetical protein